MQNIIFNRKDILVSVFNFLFIVIYCIGVLSLFTAVVACIICKADFRYELMTPLTSVILGVSSFICAFTTARLSKENGLILGLFCASVICVYLISISVIINVPFFNTVFFIKICITYISAAAGGIIGVNTN